MRRSTVESFMNQRVVRSVLVGAFALAVASIILFVAYAVGFRLTSNTDNIWRVLELTIPFALFLALVTAAWPNLGGNRSVASWLILIILAVALGCGYWLLIARTLGFGSMSLGMQALACWIAAAVAGLLLAVGGRTRGLLGSTLACVLAIFVPAPIFNLLAHNQALTVAIVVPDEMTGVSVSPRNVGFDSQSAIEASASRVLQSIRAAQIQGNYRVVYQARRGEGKQSLAILLLNAPVTASVQLPEPDGAEVLYVQGPHGWTKTPLGAPTLHRNIEIWGASDDKSSLAYFGIPDATGVSLDGRVAADDQSRQ
jgi:hypothetical protein